VAVREVGGFAEDLPRSFDVEHAYRLHEHGLDYAYAPAAAATEQLSKGARALTADARNAGIAGLELHRRHPAMLPELEIGGRAELGVLGTALRRLLIRMCFPIAAAARLGGLLPREEWRRRWYRFVFSLSYWSGVRRVVDTETWDALHRWPLFLAYHAIDELDRAETRYVVPVRRFARQMAWLESRGYRVISLASFLEQRRLHRVPPARSVVITFDDGYADVSSHASPVLARHGFPATVFLVSGAMGGAMDWDRASELAGRPLLSYGDALRLADAAFDIGAHTQTHRDLTTVSPDTARAEIVGSRDDLERQLGRPVTAFAYPYGRYDAAAASIAADAGFLAACGMEPGRNTAAVPAHRLRRVEVLGTDSLLRFGLTVWLGRRLELRRAVTGTTRRALRGVLRPARDSP
jgi:peptidoglycan/xylan/chitin deacetylase (PgdA/CDA1 family)